MLLFHLYRNCKKRHFCICRFYAWSMFECHIASYCFILLNNTKTINDASPIYQTYAVVTCKMICISHQLCSYQITQKLIVLLSTFLSSPCHNHHIHHWSLVMFDQPVGWQNVLFHQSVYCKYYIILYYIKVFILC